MAGQLVGLEAEEQEHVDGPAEAEQLEGLEAVGRERADAAEEVGAAEAAQRDPSRDDSVAAGFLSFLRALRGRAREDPHGRQAVEVGTWPQRR